METPEDNTTTAATPQSVPSTSQPTSQASSQPKSDADGALVGLEASASANTSSPPTANASSSTGSAAQGQPGLSHETAFVRPSDFLQRPRAASRPIVPSPQKPKRKIDRDEEEGLVWICPFRLHAYMVVAWHEVARADSCVEEDPELSESAHCL
jgi:hypothetical protein